MPEKNITTTFTQGAFTADGDMVFAAIGESMYGKRVADCTPNDCEDAPEQEFAEGEAEANAQLFAAAPALYQAVTELLALADEGALIDLADVDATPISRKLREALKLATA